MNKEFIPYEQALELKELGFDENCIAFYEPDNKQVQVVGVEQRYNNPELLRMKDFCAPLYQQAFRWFREKHNLKGGILYIGGLKPETTWWDIYVVGHYNIEYNEMEMKYQPYEEAELACLKKLIEIVKNK
jgi:hypothetical protein